MNIIVKSINEIRPYENNPRKNDKAVEFVANSIKEVKAYRLADNKVAECAEWDFNMLEAELAVIEEIDMSAFDFDTSGINAEDYGNEFSLQDGDKNEICQMSFTLHENQKELILYAIETVADCIEETFGNTNQNGNALYEVVKQWAEQRK